MTQDNWKTLRVPTEQYEKAKAQKEEHGRTWGEQVVRPTDNETDTRQVVDVDAIRDELNTDAPTYDDVKAACATAIEEELGEVVGR